MVTIDELYSAFSEAEEDIKFAELSIDSITTVEDDECFTQSLPIKGVVIPSVNELRYAAKHLLVALWQKSSSEKEYEEQIQRAYRHCIRARLDALRATILFFIRDFYAFSQDYRFITLSEEARKKLNDHRQKINFILNMLSKYRLENEECNKLKSYIEELRNFYFFAESQRSQFNILLDKMSTHEKTTDKQFVIGTILTVIGTILTIIGIALTAVGTALTIVH
jgi:hypothetical protein